MAENQPHPRRRFQFRLRTLIIVVTVVSVGLGLGRSGDFDLTCGGVFIALAVVLPLLVDLPPHWRWLRLLLLFAGLYELFRSVGLHCIGYYMDD
jgi:hypothetical protein